MLLWTLILDYSKCSEQITGNYFREKKNHPTQHLTPNITGFNGINVVQSLKQSYFSEYLSRTSATVPLG
jgi:hypothetical protein